MIDEQSMLSSIILAVTERNIRECAFRGQNSKEVWGGVPARTTGYLLGFPATLILSTVLWALQDLMYGGGFHPVPGLRATSQSMLMSTTKVNEACSSAPTRHETKVGISTDSPH